VFYHVVCYKKTNLWQNRIGVVKRAGARNVTRLDGARGKKQDWRPHVGTRGFSEANALCTEDQESTCDTVGTFRRPGIYASHCSPLVTPLAGAYLVPSRFWNFVFLCKRYRRKMFFSYFRVGKNGISPLFAFLEKVIWPPPGKIYYWPSGKNASDVRET